MNTTSTHIDKKEPLVPDLRFREFSAEWENKKLSNFIDFISGYAFKSDQMKNHEGKYQLIKMSNVYKNELQLERNPSYWDEIDSKQAKFLLRKKDIILTLTGTVGKKDYGYSAVIPTNDRFLLNQRLVCLRYITNTSDGDFINNLIKTSRFYYFFFSESKGGTGNQSNVGIEDLRNIKLRSPSLPEQQKIAAFLGAVDEKIRQLTRQKELLEQYKKGVMQKLFTYEKRLVSNGNLRKGRLGDFGYFYYGKGAPKTTIFENAPTPCVRYGELYSTYDDEIKEIKSYTIVEPGDLKLSKGGEVLVPRVGEDPLDFANCSYLPFPNVAIGEMISVYNTEEDGLFMTYYINAMLRKQLARLVEGGNVSNLYFRYVETIEVEIPDKEEQIKIIDFITNIDTKIASVNNQITQTQTFKKGLLQRMFV